MTTAWRTLDSFVWRDPLRRFISTWVLLAICTVLCVRLGHPFWLTNDDLTRAWVASGRYSGTPSAELGEVNALWAFAIVALYRVGLGLAWYPWVIAFTNVTALAAVSALRSKRVAMGWLPLAMSISAWSALRPNFTVAAIVAASAGLALVANGLRERRLSWVGVVLFLVGAAWRMDSSWLALGLFAPVLLVAAWNVRNRWFSWATLAILPIGLFILAQLNRVCWATSDCQAYGEYLKYNAIRFTFHTAPRGDLLAALGDQSGTWSHAATTEFINYAYPDDPMFSLPALQAVNASSPMYFRTVGPTLGDHVLAMLSSLSDMRFLVVASAFLVLLPTVSLARQRMALLGQAAFCAGGVLVAVTVLGLVRLPQTITFGAVVALAICWATVSSWAVVSPTRRGEVISTLSMTVGVLTMAFWLFAGPISLRHLDAEAIDRYDRGNQVQQRLDAAAGDALVFGQGNLADFFVSDPYSDSTSREVRGPLLSGWPVFSPAFEARRQALGFRSVYADLRAGRSVSGAPTFFAGSATNAQRTAEILTESDPQGRTFTANELAPLTNPDDTIAGEVYLWQFQPS